MILQCGVVLRVAHDKNSLKTVPYSDSVTVWLSMFTGLVHFPSHLLDASRVTSSGNGKGTVQQGCGAGAWECPPPHQSLVCACVCVCACMCVCGVCACVCLCVCSVLADCRKSTSLTLWSINSILAVLVHSLLPPSLPTASQYCSRVPTLKRQSSMQIRPLKWTRIVDWATRPRQPWNCRSEQW